MNRQGFLGGSDMVRIINGDWHKLWLEKTGRVELTILTMYSQYSLAYSPKTLI
jgi:hypothetical protein